MIDIKYIVNNKDEVINNLNKRNADYTEAINKIVKNYNKYVEILKEEESIQAQINTLSKSIGQTKAQGGDIAPILSEVESLKVKIKDLDSKVYKEKFEKELLYIPNMLDESTPLGKDEEDNVEIRKWGEIPTFDFEVKEHFEIASVKNDFDFEKAAQIVKSRFVITKNFVAKLERALTNFMLDLHSEANYEELAIPYLISSDSFQVSGQLPKFKFDAFKIDNNNKEAEDENEIDEVANSKKEFYLISTGEAILANIHQKEMLDEKILPAKYMAYSQCFRKEVGSAGKDITGIVRMHQFGKVELFKYVKPNESNTELESMVNNAERVLQELELPYRVLQLCSGDMGFTAAKTYDLEVWFPAQGQYRECSSCSNVKDFQARRGQVKFKDENGKKEYVHMLNGSGMATGRILAAILENYQQEDGTVKVPEKLKPYMR